VSRAGAAQAERGPVEAAPEFDTLTVSDDDVQPFELATYAARDLPPPLPRRKRRRAARGDLTLTVLDDELHPLAFALPWSGYRGRAAVPPPLTCGSMRAAALLGEIVADKYRVLACLGRGGMGVVYKVERLHDGKILAMKVLPSEFAQEPTLVERFRTEARATMQLSHPNTIKVFELGQTTEHVYLVMEYLQGEDLGSKIQREGPQDPRELVRLALQICESLEDAHAHGIVHRDVKPENVFVLDRPEGQVKVLDFGVAKLPASDDAQPPAGFQIVGTPYYMAPEQIAGITVDGRADVYALGGLLYTALTGVAPFSDGTQNEVLAQQLHAAPMPMREQNPGLSVSDALEAVVQKALRKCPSERQASMGELAAELCAALEEGSERPARRSKKKARTRKRRPAA
jgi:serine/threonine-protein kinase